MKIQALSAAPLRKRVLAAAIAAVAGLMLLPASGMAATTFGTNVSPDLQPSNAGDGHTCEEEIGTPGTCTWVMNEAYSNGGPLQTTAPVSGTLKRINWIAQAPGSFRLVVGKLKNDGELGRITYRSDVISYQGQPANEDADTYVIESAKVKTKIKAGQYLGIEADSTSMLRCSSGGPNTVLFQPPLEPRSPFAVADGDTGCWLLLQGVIK